MESNLISCNLDGKTIDNVQPNIKVQFWERSFSLNSLKKMKCYLDKKKIIPQLIKNSLTYTPIKKLKKGSHKLKLKIKYKNGKKKEYCFRFNVNTLQQEYSYFYGIPHSHTSYSSGKGTPSKAYKYAAKNELDFLIISDHYSGLKKTINESSSTTRWNKLKNESKNFKNKRSKFLPLYGYETKGYLGSHINILFSEKLIPNLKNLKKLKEVASSNPNMIISLNHPAKKILKMDYDSQLDKVINLIEVANGSPPNKYKDYYDLYFKMLDKGWHLGALNSQDNHLENWGDSDNLTAIIADKLSYKSFAEALKKRRVYSTESKSLKLKFLANNKWMGSLVPLSSQGDIDLYVKAEDKTYLIKNLEIISNKGEVIFNKSFNAHIAEFQEKISSKAGQYYVAKVTLSDNKSALSSAIYVI
ncbi:hypothetical protein SH2C18_15920 [Clostridium sediminicola]|uniref:CehA/McbA family metallohydrolase n=1 Tax=Clostridium sediminicola TaxID=3114879 RepID=UPI0031F2631E